MCVPATLTARSGRLDSIGATVEAYCIDGSYRMLIVPTVVLIVVGKLRGSCTQCAI